MGLGLQGAEEGPLGRGCIACAQQSLSKCQQDSRSVVQPLHEVQLVKDGRGFPVPPRLCQHPAKVDLQGHRPRSAVTHSSIHHLQVS